LYSISLKLRIRDQRDDPLVQMLTNRMEVPSVVIDELTHFLHETCQLVNKTRTFILRQKKMKGENTKARACLDIEVFLQKTSSRTSCYARAPSALRISEQRKHMMSHRDQQIESGDRARLTNEGILHP
jgi:benzoyl-CoA reductase/2-hydroxyglutaryl-CoA dehydratase subunit BcrC/BadD/HgdB